MDPTATLTALRDPDTDPDDRCDAALALAGWLAHSGFTPDGETRDGLLDEIADVLAGYQPTGAAPDEHLEATFEDSISGEDRMMHHVTHYAVTSAVVAWAGDDLDRHTFIATSFARHERGDWGDVDRDDWQANNRARHQHAGRVLSAYTVPALDPVDARLWIITDDLDSPDTVTTILWPSDY